ncbi:MAG: ferritin family protein [Desulfomonile sp.]|jgi:rubrerythrin|nr:ferritin family protein [Deltaproteobacteria bacterium]
MFVFGTAEDVFTMAIRIEENGNAFYTGAASHAQDPKVKKLFGELALMEEGHIKDFKSLRSQLSGSFLSEAVWDPEGLAESYLQASADTHVFTVEAAKSRLEKGMTAAQILDVAIQFEKDSVVFFLGMKELLPDPKDKGEIDQLIKAEMDHIRMLSAVAKTLAVC